MYKLLGTILNGTASDLARLRLNADALRMLKHLHRHSKTLFQTDLGVIIALVLSAGWFMYRLATHQPIDLPTAITFIGFALLFFVEKDHAREMKAIHLKLDELLAAQPGASNRLIKAEEASEDALQLAHQALHAVASASDVHDAVSIEHSKFFDENALHATEV